MFYDLHIHSCLSPCGDSDMTVNNIVNMAVLKELDVIALTDHNSAGNCPAFLKIAERAEIAAIPGMELTTSEEVHAICLFTDIRNALAFGEYVDRRLPDIINKPGVYGNQFLLNENDEIAGEIEKLLSNAADISLFDLPMLMREFSGVFFPAHIDRPSFSLLANLGFVPPEFSMDAFEIFSPANFDAILASNPALSDLPMLKNSDAHYLQDISEPENTLDERIARLLKL